MDKHAYAPHRPHPLDIPRGRRTNNGGVIQAIRIGAGLNGVPQGEGDAADSAIRVDGALSDSVHQLVVVGGVRFYEAGVGCTQTDES